MKLMQDEEMDIAEFKILRVNKALHWIVVKAAVCCRFGMLETIWNARDDSPKIGLNCSMESLTSRIGVV